MEQIIRCWMEFAQENSDHYFNTKNDHFHRHIK